VTTHPSDIEWSDTPVYTQGSNGYSEYRTDGLSAVDWLGHRFAVGDTVLYCIGAGRGQMMALGTVKQIRAQKHMQYERDERGWAVIPRVELGYEFSEIQVQVLTERTSGSYDNTARTKPAWVNPMNITHVTQFARGGFVSDTTLVDFESPAPYILPNTVKGVI
jgi:hypothetical protein